MQAKTILFPLPERDFDVTEVAVPWRMLTRAGHKVVFATPSGLAAPQADPLLLTGVLFGQLGADPEPKRFYNELQNDPEFIKPLSYLTLSPSDFDALVLAGGHAPGMRDYLASEPLHRFVAKYWALQRPVGAICHGTIVAARSVNTETQKSVLYGYRSTCLPKYMEQVAYYLTAWKLGKYYRTYPEYVQDELCRALQTPAHFERGPIHLMARGSADNDGPAFVVEDRHYLSARWPGDAYLFARKLIAKLEKL